MSQWKTVEDKMLLNRSDISVTGGDVQLSDFVIPRLDLRPIETRGEIPTAFAVLTLGSLSLTLRTRTNAFDLTEVKDYEALRSRWRKLVSADQYDRPFLEYLLSYFLSSTEFKFEFVFEGERVTRFVVTFGRKLQLQGRFPTDVDVLATYFSSVLSVTD